MPSGLHNFKSKVILRKAVDKVMATLRKQKRKQKKKLKSSTEDEKITCRNFARFEDETLNTDQNRIRKEETKSNEKGHESFFKDQFQFTRLLFKKPRPGSLSVQKKQLEAHLWIAYSDQHREIPLSKCAVLVCRGTQVEKFNYKPPSLDEMRKARAKVDQMACLIYST